MPTYVLCDGLDRVSYTHDHTASDKQNVHGIVELRMWRMDHPEQPVATVLKVLNFPICVVFTITGSTDVVRAAVAGLCTFVNAKIHREYEAEEQKSKSGNCRLLSQNGLYVGAALVNYDNTLTVCLKRAADARVATKYVRCFFNWESRGADVNLKKPQRAEWQKLVADSIELTENAKCGLKWIEVDFIKTKGCTEIKNYDLASALEEKTEFTKKELDQLKVSNITFGNYLKAGGRFFKPAPAVDYCDVTDTDAVALFLQKTQLVYTSHLTFPHTAVIANAWDKNRSCDIVYVDFHKLRVLHTGNPAKLFMKITPEVPIYENH